MSTIVELTTLNKGNEIEFLQFTLDNFSNFARHIVHTVPIYNNICEYILYIFTVVFSFANKVGRSKKFVSCFGTHNLVIGF